MKATLLQLTVTVVILLQVSFAAIAQEQDTTYRPVEVHLQARSMFLWRGLEITTSPYLLSSVNYVSSSGNFKVGARGSAGWNGEYRQIDYFVSYQRNGLRVVVFDIFNYSRTLPMNTDLFDYNASTTRHFIDATIGYTISKKVPLDIAWSTLVAGRDRDIVPGDSIAENGKDPLRRGDNRYSTYLQLTYPVMMKDVKLEFFVGGVFTLNGQQNSFYAQKPGIAAVGVSASKKVIIGKSSFPISIAPTWNPLRKTGGIVLGINLF